MRVAVARALARLPGPHCPISPAPTRTTSWVCAATRISGALRVTTINAHRTRQTRFVNPAALALSAATLLITVHSLLKRVYLIVGALGREILVCAGIVVGTSRHPVFVNGLDVARVAVADGWGGRREVPVLGRGTHEQRVRREVVREAAAACQIPARPRTAGRTERHVVVHDVRRSFVEGALHVIQPVAVPVDDVVGDNVLVTPDRNPIGPLADDGVLLHHHVARRRAAAARIKLETDGSVVLDNVVGDQAAARAA